MEFAETFYYSNFEKDFRSTTKKFGLIDYFEDNYDAVEEKDEIVDEMIIDDDDEEDNDEFFNIDDKNKKISKDKILELRKQYNFYYLIQLNRDVYEPEDKYTFKVIFFDKSICDTLGDIFEFQALNESMYYSYTVDYLFHALNDIKLAYEKDKYKTPKIRLFLDFCLALFSKKIEKIEKCINDKEIEFSYLWYLYDLPDHYYKIEYHGKPVIFKHKHFSYEEDSHKVPYFHMNGEVYVMKNNNITKNRFVFRIPKFNGKRKISSFKIDLIDKDNIQIYNDRANKILKYSKDIHYVRIQGKHFNFIEGNTIEINRDEKAMVDHDFYFEKFKTTFNELGYIVDQVDLDKFEEDKYIMFPFVGCHNLGMTKTWGMIYVDDIRDIEFNKDVFDQLVMDLETKDIIKILVKNYNNTKFKDFIRDKGLGLLFLLHGPPGVGKTLTAEATSELLEKPLYVVNVGDLDFNTEKLEFKLKEIDEYCRRWDAIFLFDEADIFLEERDLSNIARNSIVSTFLKFLEYNKSIIFLTTNRINSIDSAVKSRINMIVAYENLNKNKRIRIWENIFKFWEIDMNKNDIEKLSHFELNGREIRNYLKIVICLIQNKELDIDYNNINQYLNTLVGLGKEFNEKIRTIYN
jgi:AAA+ superfamily predicted ATPase